MNNVSLNNDRHSSCSDALKIGFIGSPGNPEVAVLSPAGPPGVLSDPILLAILHPVSHHQHGVIHWHPLIQFVIDASVLIDTSTVKREVVVDFANGPFSTNSTIMACSLQPP